MSNSVGQDLLDVPFAEMVFQLASSVAEAQAMLDVNSVKVLNAMGEANTVVFEEPNFSTSMIGAGFQPTFYQFAETIIEVKMSVNATQLTQEERKTEGRKNTFIMPRGRGSIKITSTPINATYSNKYNYSAEGTSTLRTRLVPVPPNALIQKYIDMKVEQLSQGLVTSLNSDN